MLFKIGCIICVVFFGIGLYVGGSQRNKKLFFGSLAFVILGTVGLSGVFDSPTSADQSAVLDKGNVKETESKIEGNDSSTTSSEAMSEDESIEQSDEELDTSDKSNIDVSAFGFAENVEVTDARDITQHINLVVNLKSDVKPGAATQHVLIQTYEFLQQKDIKGANTITIGVMVGDIRVSQFTINVKKFKAGEQLIPSVLSAGQIDKMSTEVKEYGELMDLW